MTSDRAQAPLIEVGIGVVLAVISMSMATLGSFVLKWGVETAQRVDAVADHPYEQSELEVAGVLTGIVVAALIAIPVNLVLGLARGESIVGLWSGASRWRTMGWRSGSGCFLWGSARRCSGGRT